MALTCAGCGHYRAETGTGDRRRCLHCGRPARPDRRPLLVITGAAAAGKSTVCAALAGTAGLLALDGDVLAAGAAAAERQDYPSFWRWLLQLAREVQDNGLVTAYCGVGLPEQVLGHPEVDCFAGIHFLALVSGPETVRARIEARRDSGASRHRLDLHLRIDETLRQVRVPAPHSITVLDTSRLSPVETVTEALSWAGSAASLRP